MREENKTSEAVAKKEQKILALKDFKFKHGKDVYELKKGEKVEVPKMFIANLRTEKVIK